MMWPWPTFSKALGEILPGDLIVITGKTASGKTTLAMNLAWQLATRKLGRVGYLALECGPDLPIWFELMESGQSRFAQRDPEQEEAVNDAILLRHWPHEWLEIVDLPFPTPTELLTEIRGEDARKYNLILIDHLAAMDTTDTQERKTFGRVVRQLKVVAETYGIPIVVVHQIGRGERQRADFYRAPKIDDLYGSSIIEHTASIILGIYRSLNEEGRDLLLEYNKGAPIPMWRHETGMGVQVLKARHGARRYDLHLVTDVDEHGHKTDRLRDEDADYGNINPFDLLTARQP